MKEEMGEERAAGGNSPFKKPEWPSYEEVRVKLRELTKADWIVGWELEWGKSGEKEQDCFELSMERTFSDVLEIRKVLQDVGFCINLSSSLITGNAGDKQRGFKINIPDRQKFMTLEKQRFSDKRVCEELQKLTQEEWTVDGSTDLFTAKLSSSGWFFKDDRSGVVIKTLGGAGCCCEEHRDERRTGTIFLIEGTTKTYKLLSLSIHDRVEFIRKAEEFMKKSESAVEKSAFSCSIM